MKVRILAMLLCLSLLVSGCNDIKEKNSIDQYVMAAWEGDYSKEDRAEAIAAYAKNYIPVYAMNIDGDCVTFSLDYTGVSCGAVLLAPVDDSTKNAELNTIVDFTTMASVDGKLVTVEIGWWNDGTAAVKGYLEWSYLFWVRDAQGVKHYYYFRVNYTA